MEATNLHAEAEVQPPAEPPAEEQPEVELRFTHQQEEGLDERGFAHLMGYTTEKLFEYTRINIRVHIMTTTTASFFFVRVSLGTFQTGLEA